MLKQLRFDDLYTPEYYFEKQGFDCRIAIKMFNDARDTMGLADFSLSYIGDKETDEMSKNFAKTIHLRHAIEDLNNSFDLLLQIPWMFYRAWGFFNTGGSLRSGNLKNRNEIIRNSTDWVYLAEQACDYKKLMAYLQSQSSPLYTQFENFYNLYISKDSSAKTFTVRSLCNTLKHNHALKFKELYEPYSFRINTNGAVIDLRAQGIGLEFHQEFHEQDDLDHVIGRINYSYEDDLAIDVEFYGGEQFRYIDCATNSTVYTIKEVYTECENYYNALVDLFESIYSVIYPEMQLLPTFVGSDGKPNIKHNESISLNDYFSEV